MSTDLESTYKKNLNIAADISCELEVKIRNSPKLCFKVENACFWREDDYSMENYTTIDYNIFTMMNTSVALASNFTDPNVPNSSDCTVRDHNSYSTFSFSSSLVYPIREYFDANQSLNIRIELEEKDDATNQHDKTIRCLQYKYN